MGLERNPGVHVQNAFSDLLLMAPEGEKLLPPGTVYKPW
jgi:hypothetical protein